MKVRKVFTQTFGLFWIKVVFLIIQIFWANSSYAQQQQSYTNCTIMCSFPEAQQITPNNPIQYISLPATFQLTFELQVSGNTNKFPILANVLEIWSVSLKKSLVRVSLEPMYNSNQMTVFYGGRLVFHYGPATVFSDSVFTWFSLSITENNLIFGNELYSKSFPISGGALLSEKNILYTSYIEDAGDLSSGGQIRNILFSSVTHSPTMFPSLKPTYSPSGPSRRPSPAPSPAPSLDPRCCATSIYTRTASSYNASSSAPNMPQYAWQQCVNAAIISGTPRSCEVCQAYQCVDWIAGSSGMLARERDFYRATGELVHFAVGSFGNDSRMAGVCIRLTADGLDRDVIMQVVDIDNSPPTSLSAHFRSSPTSSTPTRRRTDAKILVSGGGLGPMSACSSSLTSAPQYESNTASWGPVAGGWVFPWQCEQLPTHPTCSGFASPFVNQQLQEDNLQDLCRWSFKAGLRRAPSAGLLGSYPAISSACQVSCPSQLWQATGLHRGDEADTLAFNCKNPNPDDLTSDVSQLLTSAGALSRQMNCGSPHYASFAALSSSNIAMDPDNSQVISCRRDGYTRVNSPLSPIPSSWPTESPSFTPSAEPSFYPTESPSVPPSPAPSSVSKAPTVHLNGSESSTTKLSKPASLTGMAVLRHPGVQVAMVLGVLLLMLLAVVSVCEHSLQSKAQAEWQAKKDKIRADRRNRNRAAAEMVRLSGNNSGNGNAAVSASRQQFLKMAISDDMAERRRNRSWWQRLFAGKEPLLDEMEIIA